MDFKLIFIFIIVILISFSVGAGYGATKIAERLISISADVLDIKLTDQAIQMLVNKPELMSYAIKNYKNVTNPFIKANERLHYDECILTGNSETSCYNGLLAKYGNYTR
jgi:hypothetical protein